MIVALKSNAANIDRGMRTSLPILNDGVSHVLEIYLNKNGETSYRIIDANGRASIWPSPMFETKDNSTPDAWRLYERPDNSLLLTYPDFADAGFWERYFDDDREAVATFESIVAKVRNVKSIEDGD